MDVNPLSFALNNPSPPMSLITKSFMWKIIILAFKFFSMPLLSFFCHLLHLICISYIELGFVHPITNHQCGIKISYDFLLFSSKNPLYLVFQAFHLNFWYFRTINTYDMHSFHSRSCGNWVLALK